MRHVAGIANRVLGLADLGEFVEQEFGVDPTLGLARELRERDIAVGAGGDHDGLVADIAARQRGDCRGGEHETDGQAPDEFHARTFLAEVCTR